MSLSKLIIYSILTLATAFGIGYFKGHKPDVWRNLFRSSDGHIVILMGGEESLPLEVIQKFERNTGSNVEIKFAGQPNLFSQEVSSSDLLFAPLSWLDAIQDKLEKFPDFNKFESQISTDFHSLKLMPGLVLPMLWRVSPNPEAPEELHLQIWAFATTKKSTDLPKGTLLLIRKLSEIPENILAWIQNIEFASTLEITNNLKDFPADKKAQKIRDVNLTNLKIDRSL
jgi:hypothetical protein